MGSLSHDVNVNDVKNRKIPAKIFILLMTIFI